MKEITLKFSDKVFDEFRTQVTLKGMTGNLYGITDGICVRIIEAVREGQSEVELVLKKERTKKK